ncbi:MAG: glycosyltransferase family 39 protein [Candidatus Levyibacteriota bacterium]|nr:MAG: glycosyltransferase family 39 protein [Candidatus Levybacteria bacterium]
MQTKKNFLYISFIIFFGVVAILDFFHPGLPITHDGQDHVARIANFYQNLTEGSIIPRWAANLNWGYGHPILMFLYPLPSYIASLFHFLGFSLIDSLKIVFGMSFIASGFAMYLWIKELLGEEPGLVAGILYMFAPYRFVDLYVRGAIGEHVAFVFPPLICYFLLKMSKKYSYWYVVGGAVSLASLVLSHNAITIMFVPVIILYAVYLIYQNDDKKLIAIRYMLIAIFGFGLSAFFGFPAFFEGKYTLRDIVTKNEYAKSFVNWKDFLYGLWSYGGTGLFTVQIGIVQWFVVICMTPLVIFYRQKRNIQLLIVSTFILFFSTLFLMISQSKVVWETLTILQKFQFPWRFLSIIVFLAAVSGGFFIFCLPKKFKSGAIVLIICFSLFFNKDYWHAKGFLQKDQAFFKSIYNGTTDTGESAPVWSVRFMEKMPKAHSEVISGKATIKEVERTSIKHVYEIEVNSDSARIRENTLYFPGWKIINNKKNITPEFQDPANRGLMTYFLGKGKYTVFIMFEETKLRFAADIISVFSLVSIIILGILKKRILCLRFR